MKRPFIAIAGSLNMDLVVSADRQPKLGETIQGSSIDQVPGGKGANQAVGCARLGAHAAMIGCVGNDDFGVRMLDNLTHNGVDSQAIAVLEDVPSGIASITRTPEDNCIIVVDGANGRCDGAAVNRHAGVLERADVLLVQLEIPLEGVRTAMGLASGGDATVILNPAPAQALPEDLLRLADYITPNESEWELLSGTRVRDDEALRTSMLEWERRLGSKVVVTRGKDGCSYLEEERLVTVPAPATEVVDTTGAGDTFNAALAYALGSGTSLAAAVELAIRCASLSVRRFGAQGGMPTGEEAGLA
ncbi:ribokinase [Paenibacillus sp. IB182496]|uniref:Ribokinase n=1 Tax=Paenibacillus sabuli TaxID=2772509 RepID=A0A927BS60_9BACL|nr:ribokinase [Paenibacillus sabuli]MBD2844524.1 ribokinase [Paenibacillus sabuli]